jgi:hypothetical protein
VRRTLTSVYDWQLLRLIARGGNAPLLGKALRLDWSRRTKDGTFLDDLVDMGLLEVVTPGEVEKTYPFRPAQFATTYRLTAEGERAAEYGEFEVPVPVRDGDCPPAAAASAGAKPAERKRGR